MSLLVAVFFELQYVTVTRIVLPHYAKTAIGLELAVTLVRLLTIPVYWYFYRDVIGKFTSSSTATRQKLFWFGTALLLLIPFLVPTVPVAPGFLPHLVFALASIVVGFREEIVYRAVIQNVVERKWGLGPALLVSNLIFVPYHFGALPLNRASIIEIFFGGCILGLIYAGTRSLVAAAVIHGIYDGIACFGPYLRNSRPELTLIVLEMAALVVFLTWTVKNAHRGAVQGE